jgi:2-iminobutanoate/2-iminopropanoate deaminase
MDKRQVNPWEWQTPFGFSQAWRVDGATSIVFVSGQGPIGPDGDLVGEGDFAAQARQVFENLQTVLEQSGATLEAVVKLTVFLTDISKLREYTQIKDTFFSGQPPASTAVEVTALALPEMMLEVEAFAVLG